MQANEAMCTTSMRKQHKIGFELNCQLSSMTRDLHFLSLQVKTHVQNDNCELGDHLSFSWPGDFGDRDLDLQARPGAALGLRGGG